MAEIGITRGTDLDAVQAADVDRAHRGDSARADYLKDVAGRSGLLVAHANEVAVGFGCLDDRVFFHTRFVSLLVVHPDYRRQGIGRALLDRFVQESTGEKLFTSTNLSNGPMIALLRRQGFVLCGQVSGLDDGDPELFFAKNL